jgi:hypothetical protein
MILFPLMTTWMWFQIFAALLSSGRLVEDARGADILLLSVAFEGG